MNDLKAKHRTLASYMILSLTHFPQKKLSQINFQQIAFFHYLQSYQADGAHWSDDNHISSPRGCVRTRMYMIHICHILFNNRQAGHHNNTVYHARQMCPDTRQSTEARSEPAPPPHHSAMQGSITAISAANFRPRHTMLFAGNVVKHSKFESIFWFHHSFYRHSVHLLHVNTDEPVNAMFKETKKIQPGPSDKNFG